MSNVRDVRAFTSQRLAVSTTGRNTTGCQTYYAVKTTGSYPCFQAYGAENITGQYFCSKHIARQAYKANILEFRHSIRQIHTEHSRVNSGIFHETYHRPVSLISGIFAVHPTGRVSCMNSAYARNRHNIREWCLNSCISRARYTMRRIESVLKQTCYWYGKP